MRCLVAGCGYVGSVLASGLAAEGHEAFGLRRRPEALPGGVKAIAADLCDPATLARSIPADLDAVVYAATPDSRDAAGYRRAYVDGLVNLLACLPKPGPRVLFTSSTSVYGQDDGSWVDEASPTRPPRETGRILLEAAAALSASGRDVSTLRLGGIYGPGRTRLLESVRDGTARLPAEPGVYTNRIHRDDAARALDHLVKLPSVDPVYIGVDDDPAELGDVLRWMAERLGLPEPSRAAASAPATTGRGLRTRKRCRNRQLRASGFELRHPTFREGYDAILAEGH